MFKKLLTVWLLTGLVLVVTLGCSGGEVKNLDGDWVSEKAVIDMVATIEEGGIEINLLLDEGEAEALYWLGTFPTPDSLTGERGILSEADTVKLDGSLFGSQDAEKLFAYRDGSLYFSFTMMGETSTVELVKK